MEKIFDSHVDGYYDVEDQLVDHIWRLAEETFATTEEARGAFDSIEALETYRDRIRKNFLEAIGGLPKEKTSLAPQVTGKIRRKGYTLEKVIFETFPDHHVTTNLYLPDNRQGAVPAVLVLCGHSNQGKAEPLYQQVCIDLARNGMVALVMDPIGQGERHQFYNPKTNEYHRELTTEHTYLNQPYTFAGGNVARHFVWDGIRAVDYLESRPEVDADRVGVTGSSGGGTQTSYMMLADERLAAASPNCFITSRETYMQTGQPQDGEQIIHGATASGPRYDDFLAAFAPKPVRIGSAQWDFFCVEGARQSFERASDIYSLYDAEEKIDIKLVETTHRFSRPLREAVVNWFREHLCGIAPTFEAGNPVVEDAPTLWCTSEGEVTAAYSNERTVPDILRSYVEQKYPDARAPSDPDTTRTAVIERFDLDRKRGEVLPRRITEEQVGNLIWEKVFFPSEGSIIVTGVAARDPSSDSATHTPTVVLYENGTDEVPNHEEELAELAQERGYALVFDPRGLGGVRTRDVNTNEYDGYHGTVYKLAADAHLLETSLIGMQVFDVLRAADYLTGRFSPDIDLGIRGYGTGAIRALYAAVADSSFQNIEIEDVPSFYERATESPYEYNPWLLLYGILGECDIPQLKAALDDRELHLLNG